MLAHNFVEMKDHSTKIGFNPHEVIDALRCEFCNKTPAKADDNGCATRELHATGRVILSDYNPEGNIRFMGRLCETCNGPIMRHFLRRNSREYWCDEAGTRCSTGLVPVAVDENEYWPSAAKYKGQG